MARSFNAELFRLSLQLLARDSIPARLFLQKLIQVALDEVIRAVADLRLPPTLIAPLVGVMLGFYNRHQFGVIHTFLLTVPLEILISQIAVFLLNGEFALPDLAVNLFLSLENARNFTQSLALEIQVALEKRNDRFLMVVLDFLEKHRSGHGFNYGDAFQQLFRDIRNPFLVSLIRGRSSQTPDPIRQAQSVLLGIGSEPPTREDSQEDGLWSDAEIIRLGDECQKTRVLPKAIATKCMFDRRFVNDILVPQLRQISKLHASVQFMVNEMERQGKISPQRPTLDWEGAIRQWRDFDRGLPSLVEILDQSKVSCEMFAPKLFAAFHFVLFKRCFANPIEFAQQFDRNVIQKLSYATQNQLASTITSFLCSNLADQHRRSLSILALRCSIAQHIERFFECSQRRELEILTGLHKSAIVSGSFLKLGRAARPKPERGSMTLELVDANMRDNRAIVVIDRLIVLRLRWRVLRDDSVEPICWFPEFLQLCESDPILFFRWELAQSAGSDAPAILARLGITTDFQLLPKILVEYLLVNNEPSHSISATLIPLFSRIPLDQVKIPERVNMKLLFRLDCLWCTGILHHHKVIEFLRNPPVYASQQLLSCLPFDADVATLQRLFTVSPHAFSAMLCNFSDLIGGKPRSLVEAHQLLEKQLRDLPDCPSFVRLAVAFVIVTKHEDIIELAHWLRHAEWCQWLLFFVICFGQYHIAIELIEMHPSLIQFLGQKIPEEFLFVGAGKWADSLVIFAVNSLHRNLSFSRSPDWKAFLSRVKAADWPDELALNQLNFSLLEKALLE
jgi:hypothetical protein